MRRLPHGFTAGDLPVVLAVTTTLSALLFPVLVEARARQAVRANQLTAPARTLGLSLKAIPLQEPGQPRPMPPARDSAHLPAPAPCNPSELAETWHPLTAASMDPTAWRRDLMADDRGANVRGALKAACQAAALARTPGERYESALLLVQLECDAGHHGAELEQARRLVALAPHDRLSLLVLRRAERCNGLEPLARRADKRMNARAVR